MTAVCTFPSHQETLSPEHLSLSFCPRLHPSWPGASYLGPGRSAGRREVTRRKVMGHGYLDQPGLQLVIDDDVVAVALEAVLVVVHHGLRGEDRG